MITKAELQRRASELRAEAFEFMDRRNARMAVFGDDLKHQYPGWVRNYDRQIGNRLAEAERLSRLADVPAWRRWFK